MPFDPAEFEAKRAKFMTEYLRDPFFAAQREQLKAQGLNPMPVAGTDPQFIPENRQMPIDLAPAEKLPLGNRLAKPVGKLGMLGAMPMPSTFAGSIQDAQDPNLGWKEKMIRFLGRSAGLDPNDPNMI